MQEKILITGESISQIQASSLPSLHKLFQAGLLRISPLGILNFPISSIEAYLYLYQQLQEQGEPSALLLDFIDTILIDKGSLVRQALTHSEDAVLIEEEIIEVLLRLYPQITDRYSIGGQSISGTIDTGKVVLSVKDSYAISNIQKICIAALSNQKINLNLGQTLKIVKEVLMPIYFGVNTLDFKSNLQAIRKALGKYRYQNQYQFSTIFLQFYQHYWKEIIFEGSGDQILALQKQFTLLQVIHSITPYPKELVSSSTFKAHLKALLQFCGETRASIHSLAVRVYERAAACAGQDGNTSQVFVKLFNILSCYGSHLVKDVWGSFYGLVEGNDPAFFSKLELIDIVLRKLQHHENSNVIKNCLHQFLKNQNSNRIFQLTPTVVYGSLIRMLNLGVHYLDCLFHMDSKMYPLVNNFFLKFYNSCPPNLAQHLSWLLQAISSKTNYDHALIALLSVFTKQAHRTTFLDLPTLLNTKFLLAAAYSRYPIRKRFQLVDSLLSLLNNNLNRQSIDIGHLLEYFSLINQQYLCVGKLEKLKEILDKYSTEQREAWARTLAEEIIKKINDLLIGQTEIALEQLCGRIRMLKLYQQLYNAHFEQYDKFFIDLAEEYGESRYKNLNQRYIFLTVYSFVRDQLTQKFKQTKKFTSHLESVLNSIALYAQLRLQAPSQANCQSEALQTVAYLCRRAYGRVNGENFKEREGERVIVARMMEWASDRLDEDSLALDMVIQACRSRIHVLNDRRKRPQIYTNYQHLFEETLYQLYDQLSQLEQGKSQFNKCSSLRRDKQLRLRVLITTILLNDPSHRVSTAPPSCAEIGDIIDRYDFQNYQEICWMVQTIYSPFCPVFKRSASQQEAEHLVRQLELLLENMVHNLQYSLGKKEIVGLAEGTMQILFNFAYASGEFSKSLIQFVGKLLTAGENYLLFQRVVALALTEEVYMRISQLSQLDCSHLLPLAVQILSIEEYRGFDSAIYIWEEQTASEIYCKFGADLESNYEGAVPRFLLAFTFKEVLKKSQLDNRQVQLLQGCINNALQVCMAQVAKEKMFLSGKNKLKLQMWQFLLVFPPQQLPIILGKDGFCEMVLRCIEAISHNLISQIRYYSEMFLMRLLTAPQNFSLLTIGMLQGLQKGLLGSLGSLNRTIAYIVVSGILIKYVSEEQNHPHFIALREELMGLYNCLLTFVGSSVAYFRGLSQFFCLQLRNGCLQSKYVSILRENFLLDKDAEHLMGKLQEVMRQYMQEIRGWQIQKEVLRKIPNSSRNVISDRYYMDILKQFSTQLAKINKNLDGFTAYRYIWRKNVTKGEIQEDEEDITEEKLAEEAKDEAQMDENIFQRKIDPTLDHIYAQERHSQLKVLVVSNKSQALLGHLARTGEIFGIQELILPCKKVIEFDQFKSISVTAERWLKISDLGGDMIHPVSSQLVLRKLIRLKSQGFEVIRLGKWGGGNGTSRPISVRRKCVLVLDEQSHLSAECGRLIDWELQVGRHLSLHVEASIFIWSYFKQHVRHD